ncbi:MAG: hypothetical protein QXT99_10295 [Candidatus Nitrosotenuis sp.]
MVRDLPEIQIDNKNKTVRFSKVPAIINVRAELSKNRLPYFTFIIEEGCNLIKDYLEFRMHQNEAITEDSKLIQTPSKFTSFTKIRKNLGNSVKRAFNRARFDQRPYVLRSYFSTILDNANIQHNRQKFYAGHKGDVQMTYTLRKQLSEDMIEEMRQQFKELVEPRLLTEGSNERSG